MKSWWQPESSGKENWLKHGKTHATAGDLQALATQLVNVMLCGQPEPG